MAELKCETSNVVVHVDLDPDLRYWVVPTFETTVSWSDETLQPADEDRLPRQLIGQYVGSAVRRATAEQMSDGRWYAEIDLLPGVWADGETEAEALAELESVTEGWLLLKIEDHDRDIPVLEALDLNLL